MLAEDEHIDTTFYRSDDEVPETLLHLLIRTMLFNLTRRYMAHRGERALVGSEQFIYWERGNAGKAIAPDLWVALGQDPTRDVRVWKTWEEGPPHLVVEIVSADVFEDYALGPRRYDELGVRELIIFDPASDRSDERIRWQVYRRTPRGMALIARTDADRVMSEVLGCHLRATLSAEDGRTRVRLGTGPLGEDLFPTATEAEAFERAAKEQERAAKEREFARRIAAETELEALRQQLRDLRD